MAELKSYTCSKCGGVLIFDSDHEIFDCPFCGTRFESVDFHGEELLEQAEESLKNGDFASAKDKFRKLLEKNPCDFEALRGNIFSSAKVTSLEGLKDPEFYKRCKLASVREAVDMATERTPEFASDYFAKLSELVALAEELDPVDNESRIVQKKLDEKTVDISRKYLEKSSQSFKHSVVIMGVVVIFASVYHFFQLLIAGVTDWTVFWIIEALMLVVYSAFFAGFYLITHAERKRLNTPHEIMVNASEASHDAGNKAEDIKKEYGRKYDEILKLDSETLETLKGFQSVRATSRTETEVDPDKEIFCAKCAARLTLDKEKRVYQCNSCGVAYGISLFYGLPLEKALNSMNVGKYSDADQRFSNVLMANPSDFDALLGRILCAGKWGRVSSIGLSSELRPVSFKIIKGQIDKTVLNAAEPDKAYFEKLKELISVLEELAMIDYKEKTADRQLKELDVLDRTFSTPDNRVKSVNYKERWRIEEENKPYVSKKKDREVKFSRLKESLLQMKSDSVLNK